ncbi:MAG: hypothetical protein ABIQ02_06950 [Saprospiraceae bacterium]
MMKKLYFRILLLLVGNILFLGILKFPFKNALPIRASSIVEEKIPEEADHLFPNELYYLDRNYPEAESSPDLYHQKLKESIHHDQSAARNHRGLDYPWTIEGPGNIGGRVNTIAVSPVNPDIILIGYSQGGIYRTENGGVDWKPVFDEQPSLSISQIAFNPHNPLEVFATTGDVNISGYPFLGTGIYRSEDMGVHWFSSGLNGTGVLSKIVVDPNNGNIIYAGSMGYPSHKGNERGLFRSVDGGHAWNKTLTIDDSTGVIDLITDPVRPGFVYASGWTRLRSSKKSTTIGAGTGMYRSKDFGATWENIVNDLPGENHSRTSIDISADGTLFISYMGFVEEGRCAGFKESLIGIYKSVDSGDHWITVSTDSTSGLPCDLFGSFGWYFEALKVNPENALDISMLGVDMYRTLDGGNSWFLSAPVWWTYEVHADKHVLEFSNGQMLLGTDGGAYKSPIDMSQPWNDIENIPSTQFYRTAFNPHQPDQYAGGAQDNGTSIGNAAILNQWGRLFGGDGFQPRFDPLEPLWAYYTTQNGNIYWTSDQFNFELLDKGLFSTRYWDMPLVMSVHDPKILFCGSSHVFKIDMRDTSRTWMSISPDLTRGDTILGNRYPAITALEQSPVDEMRLYAGTQDGKLWTTPDGGVNWIDITDGTPGYYVTSITCSTMQSLGVIVTYSGYRDNDNTPYIYKSADAGMTWTTLGGALPMLGVNSLLILPEWNDEVVFAATDGGVYVSFTGGFEWARLGVNFPYMPVYDLEYNPVMNTIVAATFSRGLMTFPVEELDLVSGLGQEIENNTINKISIYPTIVDDHVVVDFKNYHGNVDEFKISIMDVTGKVVEEWKINRQDMETIELKIKNELGQGLYFMNVSDQRMANVVCRIIKR